MLLMHLPEMPRLYSGRDDQGRPWTTILIPEAYGRRLRSLPPRQRLAVLRTLQSDLKAYQGTDRR